MGLQLLQVQCFMSLIILAKMLMMFVACVIADLPTQQKAATRRGLLPRNIYVTVWQHFNVY